jgi:hypothetical protein
LYVRYSIKKQEHNGKAQQILIDPEKVYDSVGKEVLYNILIEFSILMKLVTQIKMCLNTISSKVYTGKNLPDVFPIQSGLKQGDASSHCLSILL